MSGRRSQRQKPVTGKPKGGGKPKGEKPQRGPKGARKPKKDGPLFREDEKPWDDQSLRWATWLEEFKNDDMTNLAAFAAEQNLWTLRLLARGGTHHGKPWGPVFGDAAIEVAEHVQFKLARHLKEYNREEGSPKTWMYTWVATAALDHARRQGRQRTSPLGSSVQARGIGVEFRFLFQEALNQAWDEVAPNLPDQGHFFEQFYVVGLTYEEMASGSGVPQGTIGSQIDRARHRLHEQLERTLGKPIDKADFDAFLKDLRLGCTETRLQQTRNETLSKEEKT